jgi:hypothetical protein
MIDENANGCIMADEMGLGKTVIFTHQFCRIDTDGGSSNVSL